jgi:glutathione-regulated potassium-efflux system ancillary protein KefG
MPKVDIADLIDARGVADVLGLSHPNSVSTYQHRYPDMPRPIVDLGEGRCKMWLRSQVLGWAGQTGRRVQPMGDQAEGIHDD